MVTLIPETRAAELLGISPRTLQRFRVQGRGPKFLKVGKRVLYTEPDLEEYANSCRRVSTSDVVQA